MIGRWFRVLCYNLKGRPKEKEGARVKKERVIHSVRQRANCKVESRFVTFVTLSHAVQTLFGQLFVECIAWDAVDSKSYVIIASRLVFYSATWVTIVTSWVNLWWRYVACTFVAHVFRNCIDPKIKATECTIKIPDSHSDSSFFYFRLRLWLRSRLRTTFMINCWHTNYTYVCK